MLKRIAIKNYRSCDSTVFECHPKLSVLIGPNNSGKTNLLQAIMLLNKLVERDEYYHYYGTPFQSGNVRSNLTVTFGTDKNPTRLRASIDSYTDASNNDHLVNAIQKWKMLDEEKIPEIEIPLVIGLNKKEPWKLQPHLWGNQYKNYERILRIADEVPAILLDRLEAIAKFCSGMRYYSASQFTNPGASPVSFEVEKQRGRSRLGGVRGHAKTLYDIYQASKNVSDGRFSQFMDIVGPRGLNLVNKLSFKEIKASSMEVKALVGGKVEKVRREKILIVPQFQKHGEILSPNQLSEGTFKTIALLFNIITDDSTALLIEEPEVCVHQGLLSSILELIKQNSESKQMFVSTHSDYVLDYLEPENVFTVKNDKKFGTKVRQIRKAMTTREYAALRHYLEHEGNLGDYWREGGLEGISEDAGHNS